MKNLTTTFEKAGEIKFGGVSTRADVMSAIEDVVRKSAKRSIRVGFRTLSGGGTTGGEMIGIETLNTISAMRSKSALLKRGAKLITGATSDVIYPEVGGLNASWKAKSSACGQSQPNSKSKTLTPHRLTLQFQVDYSLFSQVSNLKDILSDEIGSAFAEALDSAGISGSGTESPVGILNTPGVGQVTLGPAGISWGKVCEMVSTIDTKNYESDSCSWLLNPDVFELALNTRKAEGLGYIVDDKKIAGYDVVVSNNVGSSNRLIFGDARKTVFVLFGDGYDITFDPFTRIEYGEVVVTAQVLADFAVLEPKAFVVTSDTATPVVIDFTDTLPEGITLVATWAPVDTFDPTSQKVWRFGSSGDIVVTNKTRLIFKSFPNVQGIGYIWDNTNTSAPVSISAMHLSTGGFVDLNPGTYRCTRVFQARWGYPNFSQYQILG